MALICPGGGLRPQNRQFLGGLAPWGRIWFWDFDLLWYNKITNRFACADDIGIAEAKKAEGEYYVQLDADTLDYALANIRRRPTGGSLALASDKFYNGYDENRAGHNDIMVVLMSDSSVNEWEIGADGGCEDKDFDVDLGLPTGLGR